MSPDKTTLWHGVVPVALPSITIIMLTKRLLVPYFNLCFDRLCPMSLRHVPWVGLQSVVLAFPGYTH